MRPEPRPVAAAAEDLLELELDEILALFASRLAAPGVGSAAALVTAAAAAIVARVARVSGGTWDEASASAAQAMALRARATYLVQASADAHAAAVDQLGATGESHPLRRDFRLGRALEDAAAVPLRVAEVAADVVELAALVAEHAAHSARPDAVGAAMLAEAAARTSALLVRVNLAVGTDEELLRLCREATGAAAAALERAQAADL